MAKLTAKKRKSLPKSAFVYPSKAPGSGSYPIHDRAHARAALSLAAKKTTSGSASKVRAAVARKYPDMVSGSAPKKRSKGSVAKGRSMARKRSSGRGR